MADHEQPDAPDPRARWRTLPERVQPDEMLAEVDTGLTDSSTDADADAAQREARWLFERGGAGFGV
jgi:hypothetical protein